MFIRVRGILIPQTFVTGHIDVNNHFARFTLVISLFTSSPNICPITSNPKILGNNANQIKKLGLNN